MALRDRPEPSTEFDIERSSTSRNVVSSVGGQTLYLLTQLGVMSSLAHLRGTEAVGEFGLAIAVATPLFLLGNMGLRTIQSVDTAQLYSFREYAGVRLLGIATAASLSALIGYGLSDTTATFAIVCVVTAMKVFEAISDLSYGVFQQHERLPLVFRSLALRGLASLFLFVSLLLLGAPTAVAFCAQLVVWLLVALLIDYPAASRLATGALAYPMVRRDRALALLGMSLPAGGEAVLVSLQTSIPRLAVNHFLGLEALGAMTAIIYLQQAGLMVANSVSFAILGRLSRMRRGNDRRALMKMISSQAGVMLLVGLCGVAFAAAFSGEILTVVAGSSSPEAETLLLLVSIAISIRITITAPTSLLYASGCFREMLSSQVVVTLAACALAILLVPAEGMAGAGYGILVAACVRALLVGLLVARKSSEAAPELRQAR